MSNKSVQPAGLESKPLLNDNVNNGSSSGHRRCKPCSLTRHICLPSKATYLILLWTVVVSFIYYALLGVVIVATYVNDGASSSFVTYAILAVVMMFYPLSGLVADVCCGKLKTVVISLLVLLSLSIVFVIIDIISTSMPYFRISRDVSYIFNSAPGIIVFILFIISLISCSSVLPLALPLSYAGCSTFP